jgi:hypothetical protein
MRKGIVSAIAVVFCFAGSVMAQTARFEIIGEGRGDNVRLAWNPIKWDTDITGFNVKRRFKTGSAYSPWETVNSSLIIAATNRDKELSNVVTNNPAYLDELNRRKRIIFASDSLKEFDASALSTMLGNGMENAVTMMSGQGLVYAQLMGFGFSDFKIPRRDEYQYGVFAVYRNGTEGLLGSFNWVYGTFPNMRVDFRFSYSLNRRGIILNFETPDNVRTINKDYDLLHFRVYRQSGNDEVYLGTAYDIIKNRPRGKEILSIQDKTANPKEPQTYKLRSRTYFGHTGDPLSFTFDPSTVAADLQAPKIAVGWLNEDSKLEGGVKISWPAIDAKYAGQIDHLEIHLIDRSGDAIKTWDKLKLADLPPGAAEYIDKTVKETNSEYTYLLKTVFKGDAVPLTNEVNFMYIIPPDESPDPYQATNLRAEVIKVSGEYKIKFNWNKPLRTDIKGYRLAVAYYEGDEVAVANNLPLIKGEEYILTPWNNFGERMTFAIATVKADDSWSEKWSNKIPLVTPSTSIVTMKSFDFNVVLLAGNRAQLTWSYNDAVKDLKGFRITQNNTVVASEDQVGNVRTWSTGNLPPGKHVFQIQAVTLYGLESEASYRKAIEVK